MHLIVIQKSVSLNEFESGLAISTAPQSRLPLTSPLARWPPMHPAIGRISILFSLSSPDPFARLSGEQEFSDLAFEVIQAMTKFKNHRNSIFQPNYWLVTSGYQLIY